jgi:uncharacterized protein with GYD domain
MATYLMLFRLTPKGRETITEGPTRLEAAKEAVRALGVAVKEFYLLLGQYDAVFIVEAPSDETVARAVLTLGARGTVSTETLRAFTEEEYMRFIVGMNV